MIEILDWIGRITTIIFLLTVLWAIYAWFKGILPAMLRLGNGLAKRKIVILAAGDHFTSLRDLLVDSKLFSEKNITQVSSQNDLGRVEKATLFLVFWDDWKNNIDDVLRQKKDGTALIVYAPQELGFIPREQMSSLNNHRNVTITNFRGRLLNDIVVSMITTGYEQ